MEERLALLREHGLPVPPPTGDPKITIQNAKPVASVGTTLSFWKCADVLESPHPTLRGPPSPRGRGLFSPRIPAPSRWERVARSALSIQTNESKGDTR